MTRNPVVCAALVAALLPAHAATLVRWDFEDPPANLANSTTSPVVAASIGTGCASGTHGSAATDWSTPVGNGSAYSLNADTWAVGDCWQFDFGTTGRRGHDREPPHLTTGAAS